MVPPISQKISGKAPVLDPRSEELRVERIIRSGYTVKFRRNTKLITIVRFLLAKLVYDPEGLHIDDFLALYEAVNKCLDHRDPHFQQKWQNWLITVLQLLNQVGQSRVWPLRVTTLSKKLQDHLVPFLPGQSAYYGYKKTHNIASGYVITVRNPLIATPKLPPPRFIGVGYKDKGTRRDPAIDGTFPWQYYAGDRTSYDDKVTLYEEIERLTNSPPLEEFL